MSKLVQEHNSAIRKTIGSRVTSPEKLTVGRWYALDTHTYANVIVHAQYAGKRGHYHTFKTCDDDKKNFEVLSTLCREFNGKLFSAGGGRVVNIYKFKQVKPEVQAEPVQPALNTPTQCNLKPFTFPNGTTSFSIGAKVGDRFLVVEADYGRIAAGKIVELVRDDNTTAPFFQIVTEDGALSQRRYCLSWTRLQFALPNQPLQAGLEPAPTTVVEQHPITKLTSAIDAHREEIAALVKQREGINSQIDHLQGLIDSAQRSVADSLQGYLPHRF